TQIVLTAKDTGANGNVYLSSSGAAGDYTLGTRQSLIDGQDAEFHFGSKTGTKVTQASNTFTGIDGVSFTATRAQSSTENALTLTVSSDTSTTTKNVQAFVDAYNKLKSAVDAALAPGSTTANKDP